MQTCPTIRPSSTAFQSSASFGFAKYASSICAACTGCVQSGAVISTNSGVESQPASVAQFSRRKGWRVTLSKELLSAPTNLAVRSTDVQAAGDLHSRLVDYEENAVRKPIDKGLS